jgi:plasmid stability protein
MIPTLHVHNVPDDLYARLQRQAQAHHRSLSVEIIALLQWALDEAECTSQTPLASIRRRRFFDPAAASAPGSTTLLRQARDQH